MAEHHSNARRRCHAIRFARVTTFPKTRRGENPRSWHCPSGPVVVRGRLGCSVQPGQTRFFGFGWSEAGDSTTWALRSLQDVNPLHYPRCRRKATPRP